ncbi:MAG: hypothetical protein QOJ02_937 [Acidobacteriota bacterium]|jgi:transcriptional regulator with XRE-family HTH domain|nr:hypothetical protein [Acidobacteriota bacterium]
MGRPIRPRPARLASKLLQIRLALGLTQEQMFERLSEQQSTLLPPHVSDFELDKREPTLAVLLAYARTAGIALEILADDELDLPARLSGPAQPTEGIVLGQCPYCKARDKQIKAGRNRSGSRRYQCRHCLRHYTPQRTGNYNPNWIRPPGASTP